MSCKCVEFKHSSRCIILRFRDDFLDFPKKRLSSPESCVYVDAWGSHHCNYISSNIAHCAYPWLVSDDSTVTWFMENDMGTHQRHDYLQWIMKGKQVRFVSALGLQSDARYSWNVPLPIIQQPSFGICPLFRHNSCHQSDFLAFVDNLFNPSGINDVEEEPPGLIEDNGSDDDTDLDSNESLDGFDGEY